MGSRICFVCLFLNSFTNSPVRQNFRATLTAALSRSFPNLEVLCLNVVWNPLPLIYWQSVIPNFKKERYNQKCGFIVQTSSKKMSIQRE